MDYTDVEVILLVKVQNGTLENGIEATVCFIAPKGGIDPGVVNFLFPLYVLLNRHLQTIKLSLFYNRPVGK
jgi:hypothetical protein